jgi:hypothetical protein
VLAAVADEGGRERESRALVAAAWGW